MMSCPPSSAYCFVLQYFKGDGPICVKFSEILELIHVELKLQHNLTEIWSLGVCGDVFSTKEPPPFL